MATEKIAGYSSEYLPKDGWWPTWAEHDFVGAISALRNEFIFSVVEFYAEEMPRPYVGLNNLENEGLKLPASLFGMYCDGMMTPAVYKAAVDELCAGSWSSIEPYVVDFCSLYNYWMARLELEPNEQWICCELAQLRREVGLQLKPLRENTNGYHADGSTDYGFTIDPALVRPDPENGKIYCGRGLGSVTFKENYGRFNEWCKKEDINFGDIRNDPEILETDPEASWLSMIWQRYISGGAFGNPEKVCEAYMDADNEDSFATCIEAVGGKTKFVHERSIPETREHYNKIRKVIVEALKEDFNPGDYPDSSYEGKHPMKSMDKPVETTGKDGKKKRGGGKRRSGGGKRKSSGRSGGGGGSSSGGSNGGSSSGKKRKPGKTKEQIREDNKRRLEKLYKEALKHVQDLFVYPPGEGFKFSKKMAESVKNGTNVELYLYRYHDTGKLNKDEHQQQMGQLFINNIFFCDTFEETNTEYAPFNMSPLLSQQSLAEGRYHVVFTPTGPDINALADAILESSGTKAEANNNTLNFTSNKNKTDSDYYNRITKGGTQDLPFIEGPNKVFQAGAKDEIDTGKGLNGNICVGIKKPVEKSVSFENLDSSDSVNTVLYVLQDTHKVLEAFVAILNTMLPDTMVYITVSSIKPPLGTQLNDLITTDDLVPNYGDNQAGLNNNHAIRSWLMGGGPVPTVETDQEAHAKLDAMMVSFPIPVPNGTKEGAPGRIRVHNKLAPIVKAAMIRICKETNFDAAGYVCGYCFRGVRTNEGHKATLSNHAFGSAIDFSPGNNGYHSPDGKKDDNIHMRTGNHPVVQIMANMGYSWGGNYNGGWASSGAHDYMHFEYTGKIF